MLPNPRGTMALTSLVSILLLSTAASAQSGHAGFTGWVAFDGVAYVDKQPTAKVELFGPGDKTKPLLTTTTDEHGHYSFDAPALGEFVLRISAPGFTPYEITIYMPSDFNGNLATLLKKAETSATAPK